MKKIGGILLVIIVFFSCAMIGYFAAPALDEAKLGTTQASPPSDQLGTEVSSKQHNLLFVQVDNLETEHPRLISAWFASMYFQDGAPPAVTFVQLYSPAATTAKARTVERSFQIDTNGEPVNGFWKSIGRAYDISWDGFFMLDNDALQRILEWTNGPGEYPSAFDAPESSRDMLTRTCQSTSALKNRSSDPFDWTGLAPAHFRSNLRMEIALAYWNQMMSSDQPLRCDVVLIP